MQAVKWRIAFFYFDMNIFQIRICLAETFDVSNPFYGKEGAAYVYAPQKGATMLQVIELDNGLRHYAQVIKEYTDMDISQLPGAGAAGGMGGGLLPFLNAKLQSGIEVILKTLRFEEVVQQADLILTGDRKSVV